MAGGITHVDRDTLLRLIKSNEKANSSLCSAEAILEEQAAGFEALKEAEKALEEGTAGLDFRTAKIPPRGRNSGRAAVQNSNESAPTISFPGTQTPPSETEWRTVRPKRDARLPYETGAGLAIFAIALVGAIKPSTPWAAFTLPVGNRRRSPRRSRWLSVDPRRSPFVINATEPKLWTFVAVVTALYLLVRYIRWRPKKHVEAWFPLWTGRDALFGLSLALLYSLATDQLANFGEGVSASVLVSALAGAAIVFTFCPPQMLTRSDRLTFVGSDSSTPAGRTSNVRPCRA
jgi:hypothetical protein